MQLHGIFALYIDFNKNEKNEKIEKGMPIKRG